MNLLLKISSDRCQRIGTGLLVTGFLLIAAGAILSGLALYFAGF
jgi:hypothetical protein